MKNIVSLHGIFLIVIFNRLCTAYEYYVSKISGKVEKENFSYYSLSHEGTILAELTSLSGDCDLYVSQYIKKPSYEADLYCLHSATCGIDSLIIPKSFKRPVAVGVFGHPSHKDCVFNLIFYRIQDSRDLFNYDPYHRPVEMQMSKKLEEERVEFFIPGEQEEEEEEEEEEESFLWVILRSLVMVLIEIFL